MVSQRVSITKRSACVGDSLHTVELSTTKSGHVVDHVIDEQLAETIELTFIHQVAVQVDQFVDQDPVVGIAHPANPGLQAGTAQLTSARRLTQDDRARH